MHFNFKMEELYWQWIKNEEKKNILNILIPSISTADEKEKNMYPKLFSKRVYFIN